MSRDNLAEPSGGGIRSSTIRDVARVAGVSVTTVSRVLSDSSLVRENTRDQVHAAIEQLGFVANAHARALKGTQPVIACLVPEMVSGSFAALAGGIEQVATENDHLFMLSTTHHDHDRERDMISAMCEQRVRVVILAGAASDQDESYQKRMRQHAKALARTGTRLVLCARPALEDDDEVGWVGYDDGGGAHDVTSHLLEQGHSRILVAGNNGSSTADTRVRGHIRALQEAGLEPDPDLLPVAPFTRDGGRDVVRAAVEAGLDFTAVLGLADHVAVGALRALRSAGLRVPDDVTLAGFDDIPLVSDLTPPLTSVRIDFPAVGREAARIGLGLQVRRHAAEFPTELVVRESTSAALGAATTLRN